MFSPALWDPFASFGLRADPLFGELRRALSEPARARRSAPHADYRETEQSYVFTFDVPGLVESDIELEVHGPIFSLRAERKHDTPEGFTAHRLERPTFRLAQSFTLPSRVDVENVQAKLALGVLTVTLPKAAEAQPRRIAVESTESPATLAPTPVQS